MTTYFSYPRLAVAVIALLITYSCWATHSFNTFTQESRYGDLSNPVRCYFDAVSNEDDQQLVSCFDNEVSVNIAGMTFNGPGQVLSFAKRDVYGGKYKIERVITVDGQEVVHCLFWPLGWPVPEPAIEYVFIVEQNKIVKWYGKYR